MEQRHRTAVPQMERDDEEQSGIGRSFQKVGAENNDTKIKREMESEKCQV